MSADTTQILTVNNREYRFPQQTAVVICIDGCEPDYFDAAIAAGHMPHLARFRETGTAFIADCVIPSFTNPNNMSIATGQPPAVHGICGNYFWDPARQAEVMMNDPTLLRAPTIFQSFYDAGARIAIVTAKDKLRRLLGHGLAFDAGRAICFSSEKSADTNLAEHGIDEASTWLNRPVPDVYSAELSEFVFAAGVKLMAEFKPDIMYLTTTDYVQHKHAPGTPEANRFYAMFDQYLGQLDAAGAAIAITADHGMSAKFDSTGAPAVIYVQDLLDDWLGADAARVILPITDPYVVHHGALGSFATAYLSDDIDGSALQHRLSAVDGMDVVLNKAEAAARFELPADRIGDLVMVSSEHMTLGTRQTDHDLSMLDAPLRSHGGISEQAVPLVFNRVVSDARAKPRNFDAISLLLAAKPSENISA
jgi:phosphonoacetate hydrolase